MRVGMFPLLIPVLLATPGAAPAQTLPSSAAAEAAVVPASGFAASIALVGEDILVSRTGAELRLATYPQAGGGTSSVGTSRETGASPRSSGP